MDNDKTEQGVTPDSLDAPKIPDHPLTADEVIFLQARAEYVAYLKIELATLRGRQAAEQF